MVSTLFLEKALKTLEEALIKYSKDPSDLITRDGVIQRFEYCFELAIKTIERILRESNTSKNELDFFYKPMIRIAAKNGFIDSPQTWFDFRDDRKKTSHAYDEEIAEEVFKKIPLFLTKAKKLLTQLKAFEQ